MLRKLLLQNFCLYRSKRAVIIVVGNITVGGTGKTPLVMHIANILRDKGYNVALATRGYKGNVPKKPIVVEGEQSGFISDEVSLLLTVGVPVGVGANRSKLVSLLEEQHNPDIILCDDGLQHYKLHRDIEVCVIDGNRKLGNNLLIPFGPLRETEKRLNNVDFVVSNNVRLHNSYLMKYRPSRVYLIDKPNYDYLIYPLRRKRVHAVTGIGNPDGFFQMLRALDIKIIKHAFPDHHSFIKSDFDFDDDLPIIITEKDAVKCRDLELKECYVLAIAIDIDAKFEKDFVSKVEEVVDDKQKVVGNIGLPNL